MKTEETHKEETSFWASAASCLSGETDSMHPGAALEGMEDMAELERYWKMFDEAREGRQETDVDTAWEKLSHRLRSGEGRENGQTARGRPVLMDILMKAAVVLLIVVAAAYAVYRLMPPDRMLSVASDESKNIVVDLPDGSRVSLNRHSGLSYPASFREKGGEVHLSGEAFFEVSHNPEKPFRITAGDNTIEVLGTSFSVKTENEDKETEVFVKSGRVRLSAGNGGEGIVLTDGEIGISGAGGFGKYMNEDINYLAWNDGILIYESAPLGRVFDDLKKVYGINITADDRIRSGLSISSVFDNTPGEELIEIIARTFNLSWRKEGRDYVFSQNEAIKQ